MSLIVKIGKTGKRILKKYILPPPQVNLSFTRRIERVKTGRRICAMTFDDGPMDMPASPDNFGGRSLTDVLLDTLEEFGAHGTFDVVGDTSENYPDKAGKPGSAAWGGVRYDHYPDFKHDDRGGALHNDVLIRRIIDGGHQLTSHGYRHIIFGRKSVVYGDREFLGSVDAALYDLERLHALMEEKYGYTLKFHRPPHYVDIIGDGFTSYDVLDRLGYQYLAASFDGAGWLPSTLKDPGEALEAEVRAMVEPMERALERDPNFFCGQIIFQKDGYNMARRTPVAFALRRQLELLKKYGYTVVTVDELIEESPFADMGSDDPLCAKMCGLARTAPVAYSDNTLRLSAPMKTGELAMLLAPMSEAMDLRWAAIRSAHKRLHPYCGAMEWCKKAGLIPPDADPASPVASLPAGFFEPVRAYTRREVYGAYKQE